MVWGCSKQCVYHFSSTQRLASYQSIPSSVECGRLVAISSAEVHRLWWMLRSKAVLGRCTGHGSSSLHRQLHSEDGSHTLAPCYFVLQSPVAPVCPQPAPPSPLQPWGSMHTPSLLPSSLRSLCFYKVTLPSACLKKNPDRSTAIFWRCNRDTRVWEKVSEEIKSSVNL